MSLPADACRWLGLAGSVLLAAGGVTSGALPAVSVGLQRYAGVGLVVVYFGLVVLIGAWWLLGRVLPQERSWHVHTLVLWGAPLAIGPPLFSRDVYSYLAQGAMFLSDLTCTG